MAGRQPKTEEETAMDMTLLELAKEYWPDPRDLAEALDKTRTAGGKWEQTGIPFEKNWHKIVKRLKEEERELLRRVEVSRSLQQRITEMAMRMSNADVTLVAD